MATAALFAFAAVPLPAGATPKSYTIVVDKMKFGDVPAVVHAGDRILWINHDIFQHSATARDGSFNVDLRPGASASVVVRHAGRIPFFCRYHPGMIGVLIVE